MRELSGKGGTSLDSEGRERGEGRGERGEERVDAPWGCRARQGSQDSTIQYEARHGDGTISATPSSSEGGFEANPSTGLIAGSNAQPNGWHRQLLSGLL